MTTKLLSEALVKDITALIAAAQLYRSCVSCTNFEKDTEGCRLAGGVRPPARVIALGCDRYIEEPPY